MKKLMLWFAASVDYETDRKIQDTIATEFEDRTILCIAREFAVYYVWTKKSQADDSFPT